MREPQRKGGRQRPQKGSRIIPQAPAESGTPGPLPGHLQPVTRAPGSPCARLRHAAPEPRNPMALNPQDVERIAHLARLELSAGERESLLGQLNGFFRIVDAMSAVDTRGVEPLYTPLSAVQAVALRLRNDAVTEADDRERNQRSAPAVEDGLFLVPRVIE